MSAHLSEQEQVEALQRWWQNNGRTTIVAVVLAVAVWWGFGQWQQQQQIQQENNSVLYQDVQELARADALDDSQREELAARAGTLKQRAAGTQYDWYSALILARLAFEKADYDSAAAELQHVLDGGADQGLKAIARLRLARVESARGDLARALELLQSPDAGDLAAVYAELSGDLHLQQGDTEAARIAYQQAINSATAVDGDAMELLNLKLNRVTPAGLAGSESESESESESVEQQDR